MFVLSRSTSFVRHVAGACAGVAEARAFGGVDELCAHARDGRHVVLIHARSYGDGLDGLVARLCAEPRFAAGVAADVPRLEELLALSGHGVRGYFNSYMADVHYRQMLEMLGGGLVWFAPPLLAHALDIARRHAGTAALDPAALDSLTRREREIARDVSNGLSNGQIASGRGISERTVKTHLTRIFKKLGVADRHALGMRLHRATDPEKLSRAS